ncbi:MAG: TIGR04076 family protein [bacterium]|nr:TIGR04076 family protein [bacterium]
MKTIQHEETGYITNINNNDPIPKRWYEINAHNSVEVTIINKHGKNNCPRGHRIGNTFIMNEKTPEGLCCTAFTTMWPYVKVLLAALEKKYECSITCPDSDVLLEYRLKLIT